MIEAQPARRFSYDEAAALLPEVRRITEEAHRDIEATTPGPDARERVGARIAEWAAAMTERGVVVKGLWLVDFDNGSGYYCWKFPEPGLHFFHSYDEGFGGRMRIQ
jgi:hypothetical protein